MSQGPPIVEPNSADAASLSNTTEARKKKFKFVYCFPHEFPGGAGIAGDYGDYIPLIEAKDLPMIVSECNNPKLEGIFWKVSAHGYYHYIRDEWVWLKGKEFKCEKGGEEADEFALAICRGVFPGADVKAIPNGYATRQTINVTGHWVFPPNTGQWSTEGPVKTCFTLGGVLSKTPNKLKNTPTQRPMIWERTGVNYTQPCVWPDET